MDSTAAPPYFKKITAVAVILEVLSHCQQIKIKRKNMKKCFTSGHVYGKICACENNPHAAGCSDRCRL